MNVNVFPSSFFSPPVSGSGCVVMSGGPALGRWEVKNCRTFKALSLCKQSIHNDDDFQLPQHFNHPNAPCPPGWESQAELLLCFKVRLLITGNEYLVFCLNMIVVCFTVSRCLDITLKMTHLLPIG